MDSGVRSEASALTRRPSISHASGVGLGVLSCMARMEKPEAAKRGPVWHLRLELVICGNGSERVNYVVGCLGEPGGRRPKRRERHT